MTNIQTTKKFPSEELMLLVIDNAGETLKYLGEAEWAGGGKYQYMTFYFLDPNTNQIYGKKVSRTGSPYDEYYFSWQDWAEEEECKPMTAINVIAAMLTKQQIHDVLETLPDELLAYLFKEVTGVDYPEPIVLVETEEEEI